MYHKITIVGHLGRDVELRYVADGTAVANFSVATSRKYNRSDGTQVEETIWFRVSAWRRLAETCNQYLKKGRLVLVEGRLQADDNGNPRTFTRNDGTTGASFELTAREVKFLGGARDSDGQGQVDSGMHEGPTEPEDQIPF